MISLVKSYSDEEVARAIALVKVKKREQHVPNPAGYFTKALKENWVSESVASDDSSVDTTIVFRHWYDIVKKLGYCQGQEIRDGEQWICCALERTDVAYGNGESPLAIRRWEKWQSAVKRGYSMDYLKKILKR